MKTVRNIGFCFLLGAFLLVLLGCGKKADENKPLSEVKAEAEAMSAEQLRAIATKYQEAIVAKKGEVEKFTAKLKDISVTEMLGAEAKEIKADVENINKSVTALRDRYQVYYQKLKEKGGDTSGLGV